MDNLPFITTFLPQLLVWWLFLSLCELTVGRTDMEEAKYGKD